MEFEKDLFREISEVILTPQAKIDQKHLLLDDFSKKNFWPYFLPSPVPNGTLLRLAWVEKCAVRHKRFFPISQEPSV